MKRRLRTVASVAAVMFVLVACGDDDGGTSAGTTTTRAAASTTTNPVDAEITVTLRQTGGIDGIDASVRVLDDGTVEVRRGDEPFAPNGKTISGETLDQLRTAATELVAADPEPSYVTDDCCDLIFSELTVVVGDREVVTETADANPDEPEAIVEILGILVEYVEPY